MNGMNIAFCYESVLPERGGCETYIASLARRLHADGHQVHLYACRWDAAVLPDTLHYHRIHLPPMPRFLRPWFFSAACIKELQKAGHHLSIGFDKTYGQDILYPQGGLYVATLAHNLLKHSRPALRQLLAALKWFDPNHWSYLALEKRQYLHSPETQIIAISNLVQRHFDLYYAIPEEALRVVRIATDPHRFDECDRPRRRVEWREKWDIAPADVVALFAGMNYRLKGLEPLLHSLRLMPLKPRLRLIVAGSPEAACWQRLAERLGVSDNVRFVGYCGDMRNAYFSADFLVHPTFYDPCSHVVPEAMACGLPVITTVHNGASELMNPPRDGFVLTAPHDHRALANCMTQLLDPAKRSTCAQAARRAAAQWTFEHHYRQMLGVFAEVAARKEAA